MTMNRFIHRFVSHPSKGIVSRKQLFSELEKKSLVWFGEFHSEDRITALQTELLTKLCSANTAAVGSNSKLHVVLEHFSFEMQGLLHAFQTDENFSFDEMKKSYSEIGTEGHNLDPYKEFLMSCKGKIQGDHLVANAGGAALPAIRLHGGFIPRPLASRWYKAGSDTNEKRKVLEECYEKDYLPPPGDPRHGSLLALNCDDDNLMLDGSTCHFRLIRSMMSGEDLYDPVDENLREVRSDDDYLSDEIASKPIGNLYQAQLLKDHAMGYYLSKLVAGAQKNDRFMIIAGMGHLKHHLGVPERLEKYLQALVATKDNAEGTSPSPIFQHPCALDVCEDSTVLIGSQMLYETCIEDRYEPLKDLECDKDEEEDQSVKDKILEVHDDDDDDDHYDDDHRRMILRNLFSKETDLFDKLVFESDIIQGPMFNFESGGFQKPSVDYCYVYDEDDDNFLLPSFSPSCPPAAKVETRDAYNSVGATAGNKGNIEKARAIMKHLQYTPEDMNLIGADCLYNFQGVANPHRVAKLQPGERVLDLGCGLGVDSILASKHVASSGSVLGVDLAARQVSYCRTVAQKKQLKNVEFIQGDAEKLSDSLNKHGLTESQFDVCISNGAFCLIPDKEKAFRQVYRALKPGGRMAICTTTIQSPLDEEERSDGSGGIEWPVCMRMFAELKSIEPVCEQIGFCDVEIVDAESPMEMEFDMEIFQEENPERFKIHGKYADQYAYLEDMDMDKLCKVVTVYGRKPL